MYRYFYNTQSNNKEEKKSFLMIISFILHMRLYYACFGRQKLPFFINFIPHTDQPNDSK